MSSSYILYCFYIYLYAFVIHSNFICIYPGGLRQHDIAFTSINQLLSQFIQASNSSFDQRSNENLEVPWRVPFGDGTRNRYTSAHLTLLHTGLFNISVHEGGQKVLLFYNYSFQIINYRCQDAEICTEYKCTKSKKI